MFRGIHHHHRPAGLERSGRLSFPAQFVVANQGYSIFRKGIAYVVLVHLDLRWKNSNFLNQMKVVISWQLSHQPDEWLFVLVVGLGRDVIVLEVSLSVEDNVGSLKLSFLDISFVSDQNDWDLVTDSGQILIPFWDVLVGDSGSQIEHNDSAVSSNAIKLGLELQRSLYFSWQPINTFNSNIWK